MIKKTFKIAGMHCGSCAMNIDGELEDTKGIKQSNTNYAKQQTEVEFEQDVVSAEQIKSIIKTLGYTAS